MYFYIILFFIIWCYRGEAFFENDDVIQKYKDVDDHISKDINPLQLIFETKCIEGIGCFYTGPPFYHPIYRPVSVVPVSNITTRYLLFTPSNPEEGEEIDTTVESISESSFDPKSPLKVLIHGYRVSLEKNDVQYQTKDALLELNGYNVIIVDWTDLNDPPYPQAVANARAVGAQLAKLLKTIMKTTGLKAQDIHLIGHSLGGHITGWTGERIFPRIGRITGLDPAGPYFQRARRIVRLDTTDAHFVDVIHTDGYENISIGIGIHEPIGHMDFYPNGGNMQPGCELTSESALNITEPYLNISTVCSHMRAPMYFLESIDNSECRFLATRCRSYSEYEDGDCASRKSSVAEMGFHAEKMSRLPVKSKYYLRTNDEEPFCMQNSTDDENSENEEILVKNENLTKDENSMNLEQKIL